MGKVSPGVWRSGQFQVSAVTAEPSAVAPDPSLSPENDEGQRIPGPFQSVSALPQKSKCIYLAVGN